MASALMASVQQQKETLHDPEPPHAHMGGTEKKEGVKCTCTNCTASGFTMGRCSGAFYFSLKYLIENCLKPLSVVA